MAYTDIDLQTLDLDIFFTDNKKLIHITSAGGNLPKSLTDTDTYNQSIIEKTSIQPNEFEIEINPNLKNSDISSFISLAKKGFYSYDKYHLGNFQDTTFHLVARPKNCILPDQLLKKYKIDNSLIVSSNIVPENFEPFNLKDYIS